jgi:diguanylate cyclase (GGDEF)-like protein
MPPSTLRPYAVTPELAWRLAATLFIGGVLVAIPAVLLLHRELDPAVFGVTVLAILSGFACLAAPRWEVDQRWLKLVPLVAVAEIAVAVQATDYTLAYLYFFAALYVAVVFPTFREMAPYLTLIGVALLLVFLFGGDTAQETALWTLAIGLPLLFTTIAVGRLTANLESSRQTYRALLGVDGLTGVGNYRALMERLRHETARHGRKGRQFAVLSLDLDGFKAVNDTQGHLVGDLLLAIVASMIDLEVRIEDAVYRQGGDEFTVIAPETNRERAWLLAARIERSVGRLTAGQVKLSASFGAAVFPQDGVEPGELLDAADSSLRLQRMELAGSRSSRSPAGRD